ncbi:MAG: DUF1294 domain-containing protein [Anaeroplasmataceae bacterium]
MNFNVILIVVYLVYVVLISMYTLLKFKKDKQLAKQGGPKRIKEKTLLSLTALGGGIGAFFARTMFRHKTDKKYFSFVIYISVLIQVLVLVTLVLLAVL